MANPPITIGELTDVPAPESPINAAFHQEVANRVVHRFASVALLNGWAADAGSMAYVTATGLHYRRTGGAWEAIHNGDVFWQSYAVWYPAGAWSFSPTGVVGRYMRIGAMCLVHIEIPTWGGVGASGPVKFTLRFAPVGESVGGDCLLRYDSGVARAAALVQFLGAAVQPFPATDTHGAIRNEGFTPDWPNGPGSDGLDHVVLDGWYRTV